MSRSKKPAKDSEENIYGEYFKLTKEYQEKFGQNTFVLMQVGSFFEVYGVRNTASGEITESKIVDFSEVCQMNIADKKNCYGKNGQVIMAGFGVYLLEKYLPKITDGGYTAVVYIQEKEPKVEGKPCNRVLYQVFSPGTYVCCDTDSSTQITNNIMCIWSHISKPLLVSSKNTLSKVRDTITYGVSVINIFTGKSYMFEYQTQFFMNNTTFDELERFVSIYSPSEVLFLSPFEKNDVEKILQYAGIRSQLIHRYDTRDEKNQKIVNCTSQRYAKQILTSFFNEETYDLCSEFHTNIMATQSFCYLLNFIQEHNPDLVRKISIPIFNNTSDRLVLANHTLIQLNIIDEGTMSSKSVGQFSSVLSFLNKCCSPIGKRKFQYQLTNPTFDMEWLNIEYENIEKMLLSDNYVMVTGFRKLLTQIRDIEKICRQIVLRKIYPSSIAHLYKTIDCIQQMNTCLYECPEICNYLCNEFDFDEESAYKYIDNTCFSIKKFLDSIFIIDLCKTTSSMTSFESNIIKSGVSDKLDTVVNDYETACNEFSIIREYLNKLMQQHEKSPDSDYIKIHETEKSGSGLQITSKRSKVLEKLRDDSSKIVNVNSEMGIVEFKFGDIKFSKVSSSSSNMDIESPQLMSICKKMLTLKESINKIIVETYLMSLSELEVKWLDHLENLTSYISKIDVLQCKTYLAKEYNYCRPTIDNNAEKSFVDAKDIRHCLIEHLQQNELYVTNDVMLGKVTGPNGFMLYGTNAVGKTSLIRAVGVSIVIAQAGMFVPCSSFTYKPYTAIYSRILGNDNIFKGLSTFAVEMSELRIILKMADKNSLILGDELCSGTETQSALSIFVAGLMKLDDKRSSFIFATHFHEIVRFKQIQSLKSVTLKHMAVSYDRESDCLIYDRKLRDGSGPKSYGLEVCKSFYLDDEFLELAYSIRNEYYPDARGELSHTSTRYNSEKIRGLCEICKERIGEEIHHLQQQKDANDTGFIGSIHKNHKANLVTVCEECHNNFHSNESSPVEKKRLRIKTTKGYKIT
jgi:DNA mismatch repair protein MutS